jgi:hypothetical protein
VQCESDLSAAYVPLTAAIVAGKLAPGTAVQWLWPDRRALSTLAGVFRPGAHRLDDGGTQIQQ